MIQMTTRFFAWRLMAFAIVCTLGASIFANNEPALEQAAIKEVIAMVEGGVADYVIIARIEKMEQVPLLGGQELAVLKKKGVSDQVLLALVESATAKSRLSKTRAEPSAAAAEGVTQASASPAPAPALTPLSPGRTATLAPLSQSVPEPLPEGAGLIRVRLRSSFRISYYEVVLDGRSVATKGAILTGQSEPGMVLARASFFRPDKDEIIFEQIVPKGQHALLIGFAISEVNSDPEDPLNEYSRESYESRGVRAETSTSATGLWGVNRPAICKIAEGEICELSARLSKRRTRRFGASTIYAVDYKIRIKSE